MEFFALVTYFAVMAITPGPNNLMLATSGVNFGFRKTVPHIFGIVIGHGIQVFIVVISVATALSWISIVRPYLALVGCVYLFWLSWKIWKTDRWESVSEAKPMTFLAAAVFQWVNPKAWIMVLNLSVLFSLPQWSTLALAALFTIMSITITFPCVCIWAFGGDRLRLALQKRVARQIFNAVMAVSLAVTSIVLLWDEAKVFFGFA